MPLTILSDSDVKTLLHSLTRDDILELQQSLADALHYYSTATENENGCSSTYQPQRTFLKRKDGSTTLFMPASSNDGLGVKIVTLPETSKNKPSDLDSSVASMSLSANNGSTNTMPRGSLTLLDALGFPRGLINAEEITAFRTALASTMLFKKRHKVHDLTVFGAGKQAYWHIRLALLLRETEVHHLNIINRSFETARALLERLYAPENNAHTAIHRPEIKIVTPYHTEYDRHLKSIVRSSNAIFLTTPSVEPLFPANYLTSTEGRKKGRYIAAIGSYKPHMIEIHPEIIRQAVAPHHTHHHHKHAKQGGAVVVDSLESCLREAGEIIQAKLQAHEVVELGELVMLKRDAEKRRSQTGGASPRKSLDASGVEVEEKSSVDNDGGLKEWLERGNVIYKSVGLGLMDVVVGGDLVNLADGRGYGTKIENF